MACESTPLLLACSLCSLVPFYASVDRFHYFDHDHDDHHRDHHPHDFDDHLPDTIIQHVESVVSSLFHMPAPKPTDVPVLAVAVFVIVVFHAVQPDVLTLVSPTAKDWMQTVASFIEDNKVPLHKKANTITAQVAATIGEMKHRNIIPRLNLQHLPWEFPDKEARIFATELSQSIVANLM
ncbi:hypothetical protein DFH08DRAFT_891774 [Mycena albidolilacea]|uniref:Uncharacterized protein n=1 Tax=Mycena albidolilacea TaxID=1033008 RepID=A0AAD7EG40_9AGAR|nr:hypothetical protein DFH08DRAFT_891774 [Mycena albidolilacea]